MSRTTRMGGAVIALALASAATPALAQIPGMPLFTNPRYGTGFRIHADYGRPTEADPNGDLAVAQAGVTFALGPIGIGANVGTTMNSVKTANQCSTSPTPACLDDRATVSALAQLRVMGGGRSNLSVSVFGGGSMDLDSADAAAGGVSENKRINVPLGVAVGYRLPLGMASLNLWGAGRYNLTRYANCTGTCTNPDPVFGWAVGADLPIFRILSVRAAYDSHKPKGATEAINVFGVGASIGLGGMR